MVSKKFIINLSKRDFNISNNSLSCSLSILRFIESIFKLNNPSILSIISTFIPTYKLVYESYVFTKDEPFVWGNIPFSIYISLISKLLRPSTLIFYLKPDLINSFYPIFGLYIILNLIFLIFIFFIIYINYRKYTIII